MMKFLFIILMLPLTVFAEEWKCSNWKPVISPILVHTGARGTIIRLSLPTSDLRKAKEDFSKSKDTVKGLKQKLNYDFSPVLVKTNNTYQVILSECYTQVEAASVLVKLEGHSGIGLEKFKANFFQTVKDPDCVHCR